MAVGRRVSSIGLSRTMMARVMWLAAGALGPAGCSDPSSSVVVETTATMDPSSDGQVGVVGSTLGNPLRIQVRSGGSPKAGVPVQWHTQYGSFEPAEGITDADGFAEAAWTLGTYAERMTASVTFGSTLDTILSFHAQALPGPAAAIHASSGSGQAFPANLPPSNPLVAIVTDQYGNAVSSWAVSWTVERGPVEFVRKGGASDEDGRSVSTIAPSGGAGDALVRAALPGIAAADFALSVGPPVLEVLLTTNGTYAFVSAQNGSRPAVDTIPAGATMVWTIEFDYDNHGVASVGTPSFQGGDYPYASPSVVRVTFPTPGTYHYADPYYPVATGVLVVQ
jgi:hypothetical protein